jgi:hypothetical protein
LKSSRSYPFAFIAVINIINAYRFTAFAFTAVAVAVAAIVTALDTNPIRAFTFFTHYRHKESPPLFWKVALDRRLEAVAVSDPVKVVETPHNQTQGNQGIYSKRYGEENLASLIKFH